MNRLEEIKNTRIKNFSYGDVDWLIKRVEELEKSLGDAHEDIEIYKNNLHDYRKRARHYRKALKLIVKEGTLTNGEKVGYKPSARIALQSLEGDNT